MSGILISRYIYIVIIVYNFFCILLFSAGQNCLYLRNWKSDYSDFNGVFSKNKLFDCFTK